MESNSENSRKSARMVDLLPPVILNPELQILIRCVKELKRITTYEEVLDGLGKYIESKRLYNPATHKVCCKGDGLSSIINTDEFAISELNTLLPKLAVPAYKICQDSSGAATSQADNPLKRKLEGSFELEQRKIPPVTPTSPMFLHIPPSPTYCDVSDSVDSIQGYETAFAKDTSDELCSENEDGEDIFALEETFDIEYEVETDSSDTLSGKSEDSDSDDFIENVGEAIFHFLTQVVYKPKPDDDVEFFADASSNEDEQSDAEIGESDFWGCPKCLCRNKPTVRYCLKCFQQRRNWLPDKPSNMRRRRRKIGSTYKESKASLKHEQDSGVLSLPTVESVTPHKDELDDSTNMESKNSQSMESSGSLYMDSSDSALMKYPASSTNSSSGISSGVESSYAESSGPSSMEMSGPASMESYGPSSMESYGPSSMESCGPCSMECKDASSCTGKLCMLCCSSHINASIIHGKIAHQVSCYKCARKLQKLKKCCPLCRRAIEKVVIQISI